MDHRHESERERGICEQWDKSPTAYSCEYFLYKMMYSFICHGMVEDKSKKKKRIFAHSYDGWH